ncbi:MAG TPA: peptidoglycan-binding protein [Nostoc sp.]|uniref:peptidoglycan-binding domain-containing protein n=1 Tax=Nostoc sp. TaxID=1180 RepID=UPI002D2684C9|nr:peptidoglycan-binding protein [Nostoc sp.]HYX13242.1 peptidoglycan-binding protein [Nostoc sp.]
METRLNSYLTKLASVYEASESVKVVPSVANFKFNNLKKLSSGAAMRLLSVALITGLLSIAGQALALQKIGSNGAEVSSSQRCLKKLGYFNGPVSGKFASLTQNAVIKFQQANRIAADGVVGASTQRALQRACQSRTFSRNTSGGQYPVLSQGKTGAAVTRLQQRLRQLDYLNTNPTGNFGPMTRNAVIAFQRNYRISANGIVNQQTWNALLGSSATPGRSKLSTQQVKELQVRLRQLGYFNTAATGNIGPITREAVTRFQRDYRLPVDGIANAQVLESVRRASTPGYTTQQPSRSYLTVGDQGDNFNYTDNNAYVYRDTNDYVVPQTNRYVLPPPNGYVVPVSNGNTLVANNPYRVIVPISNNDTLSKVQQYIPDAVTEQSHLGDYVNAGAFSDRAQAETLSKMLRSYGLDARVKYN